MGTDAIEIMNLFFEKFNINSEGFDEFNFFQGDPIITWNYFINQIVKRKKYDYPLKPPLTIGHLIKVAEKEEWFEPE
ncbi:DUF1493 family protein [Apibacter sp. HY039]|uniref:DUF1493 family protein n=1 Tax=Apibacter sp. HY039 TaxID=2501476 RepID=UPI00210561E4|nr:DUF1493 family protein [Apibacter sp. HY039]